MNPNLKQFFFFVGGGGGGVGKGGDGWARVSDFFFNKESKSKKKK